MQRTAFDEETSHPSEPESLVSYAQRLCDDRLNAYLAAPHDAEEHANIETSVLAGGYAYRQVAELVQNAADAISETASSSEHAGRIVVEIDNQGLWAANTGTPIDRAGVRALLNAHSSNKRAGQIGRFGLGFKSLLRLGGRIDVLSRSVCLRFDPDGCRTRIRDHLGLSHDAPTPALRLATSVEWATGRSSIVGSEGFDWATTVVFAELRVPEAREAVSDELRNFPAEFLLFLPCDTELELRGNGVDRHLRRRTEHDGTITIEDLVSDKQTSQRWRVFETSARIDDDAALDDATSVHARESVPLIWATPVGGQREVAGRFYAFFPTTTETRTLGILNAPWKLNSDRTAVIPGAWNSALMAAAAELILSRLPDLSTDEDPGAILDAFPRELQTQNEPAAPLVNALWAGLLESAALPNCDGEMRSIRDLCRAPNHSSELIASWSSLASPEACQRHLHATCTVTRERVARLNELVRRSERIVAKEGGTAALRETLAIDWLELAANQDPVTAVDVVRLADEYAKAVSGWEWDRLRDKIEIILTADGRLATAPEVTFERFAEPPIHPVHEALLAEDDTIQILQERFHVRSGDDTDWTRIFDRTASQANETGDWSEVWKVIRRIPRRDAARLLSKRSIHVRTLAGWAPSSIAFRFGKVVTPNDLDELNEERRREAEAVLVDGEWHQDDAALLSALELAGDENTKWLPSAEPKSTESAEAGWLRGWRWKWLGRYHEKLGNRPARNLLEPEAFQMPAGWQLLLLMEGAARGRITSWILSMLPEATNEQFGPVTFQHSTRPGSWPSERYPHPLWEVLLERGVLEHRGGRLAFSSLLCEDFVDRAALIPSLQNIIHRLDRLASAGTGWKSAKLHNEAWKEWLDYAAYEHCRPSKLSDLYALAADAKCVPEFVSTSRGRVPLNEMIVAHSEQQASLVEQSGLNAIALKRSVAEQWIASGAKSFDEIASIRAAGPAEEGAAAKLMDVEPLLTDILKASKREKAYARFVKGLVQVIGDDVRPVDWAIDTSGLMIDASSLAAKGWRERVRLLFQAAAACGWVRKDANIDDLLSSGTFVRRRAVAEETNLPKRLIAAVGNAEVIFDILDPDIRDALKPDIEHAASIALRMFGPAILTIEPVREAMHEQGLEPPERWGGIEAARFVTAIGFPAEDAVPPSRRRDPELIVSGPLPLKPLHDFQIDVIERLDTLCEDHESKRRRAVISLPTGAGKTRVAAEFAVTRILNHSDDARLVLWIAQTDELCEQAVQCFRELWTNLGTIGETLRIVRLWGGQVNPRASDPRDPAVIVASIQTLSTRILDEGLSWAGDPGLIVIDECHHALTPSYTGALRWLNPETKSDDREPPIIGLSATPFRGRSNDESLSLARRFDERLFPPGQSDLFDTLQKRGVLARFAYTKLQFDHPFELTEEEKRSMDTFKRLPESALVRLGEVRERNDMIVEAIRESAERSALVFATSVAHARRLAARLNLFGVSAAVVSGETDRNSRRWFIERFQRGEVRVLCNHSALTTGFDAPATDLIVIARPVFSPSMYMQMVGRGLRGPVNGGKDFCRILTVQDNLDQYTGMLAHHYFEKYYV